MLARCAASYTVKLSVGGFSVSGRISQRAVRFSGGLGLPAIARSYPRFNDTTFVPATPPWTISMIRSDHAANAADISPM